MSSVPVVPLPATWLARPDRGTAEVLTEAAGLLAGLEPMMAVPALLGLVTATSGADRAWLDPAPGTDELTASLPLTRSGSTVAVLALAGGRPEHLPRALLDLLAVAVAPDRSGAAGLAAECDDLLARTADALHDGPSQEAAAARMAAALLERSTGAPATVSEAVAQLARSLRMVTAAARPRGADGDLGRTLSMVLDCHPEQGPVVDPALARLAWLVAVAAAEHTSTTAVVDAGPRGSWTVVLTGAAAALGAVCTQHGARAGALGARMSRRGNDLLLQLPAGIRQPRPRPTRHVGGPVPRAAAGPSTTLRKDQS